MLMATAGKQETRGCSFRRAERGCSDRVYKLPVEWMIGWCTRKYNLVFLGQQLQQVPRRQRMAPARAGCAATATRHVKKPRLSLHNQ